MGAGVESKTRLSCGVLPLLGRPWDESPAALCDVGTDGTAVL